MARGIAVETTIEVPVEAVSKQTQEPHVHQRWDLRFSRIEYLPQPDPAEPQRFLYATRIGAGMSFESTG